MPLSEMVFAYMHLRNDNGWRLILIKTKNGWQWLTTGSDKDLFDNWVSDIRPNFTLTDRIIQQIIQLILLDYGFIILFLASCSGLTLGLMISAASPSREVAIQLVPYITIYQIIMSKEVIISFSHQTNNFLPLASNTLKDILAWDFGAILSLFTTSRYLQVMIENLAATAKNYDAGWSYLFTVKSIRLKFSLMCIPLLPRESFTHGTVFTTLK